MNIINKIKKILLITSLAIPVGLSASNEEIKDQPSRLAKVWQSSIKTGIDVGIINTASEVLGAIVCSESSLLSGLIISGTLGTIATAETFVIDGSMEILQINPAQNAPKKSKLYTILKTALMNLGAKFLLISAIKKYLNLNGPTNYIPILTSSIVTSAIYHYMTDEKDNNPASTDDSNDQFFNNVPSGPAII